MTLQITKNIINPQWFTGVGVTLLLIQLGLLGGWTSPTMTKLLSPDSPIPVSPDQVSWVVSLINLSRFFGSILGTASTHYFGSKRTIFVTLFPISIGWLVIALASTVEWLYVARLCSGLSLGMVFGAFPLFIGEVAMTQIRGALISLGTVGVPFGQLIAIVVSTYLSISAAASLYLGLALPLVFLFFWLPESPHHLVKVGRHDAAKSSIEWYRSGQDVDAELESIHKLVVSDSSKRFVGKLRELMTSPVRSSTMQIMVLFAFTQLCGLNVVLFYTEMILVRAKFTLITPAVLVICINLLSTASAAASIFLIDRFGRKFLLLISTCGIFVSMVGLMCHFLLMSMDIVAVENLQWLPLTSMVLFMVSFFLGLFPVPNTILGEIFPSDLKCTAACIALLVGACTSFVSAKTYQPLLDSVGDAYVFMIYAILSIFMIPYALLVVHETKGKSLQQIQNELSNS